MTGTGSDGAELRTTSTVEALAAAAVIEEVKAFLRPIQRRETQQLSDLLGRRFDEWTTLHAGDA